MRIHNLADRALCTARKGDQQTVTGRPPLGRRQMEDTPKRTPIEARACETREAEIYAPTCRQGILPGQMAVGLWLCAVPRNIMKYPTQTSALHKSKPSVHDSPLPQPLQLSLNCWSAITLRRWIQGSKSHAVSNPPDPKRKPTIPTAQITRQLLHDMLKAKQSVTNQNPKTCCKTGSDCTNPRTTT